MKIVKARIEKGSTTRFTDPYFGQGRVFGAFEDGREELLFTYYLDELSFVPEEFIGKTMEEAREIRYRKDVAYLRS